MLITCLSKIYVIIVGQVKAMVDGKKLGFSQGVDISFLAEEAQGWVQVVIEEKGCNVNMVQSAKIKEYGKTGELTHMH